MRAASRLKMRDGSLPPRPQFLRQGATPSSVAIAVQHSQHEKIPADENVPRHPFARLAQHARDRAPLPSPPACGRTGNSASSGSRCAATPGKAPAREARRSPGPAGPGLSCTACGTSRTSPTAVCACPSLGGSRPWRSHDPWSGLRRSRTGRTSGRSPLASVGIDDETADEALPRAELVLGNLMAHRARHAVGSQAVGGLAGIESADGRRPRLRGRGAWPRGATSACDRSSTRPRWRRGLRDDR